MLAIISKVTVENKFLKIIQINNMSDKNLKILRHSLMPTSRIENVLVGGGIFIEF